jgi:hypothetical protein
VQQIAAYSITSSARSRIEAGTSSPSARVDQVHHKFELDRLLDRQVGRLFTLKNAI